MLDFYMVKFENRYLCLINHNCLAFQNLKYISMGNCALRIYDSLENAEKGIFNFDKSGIEIIRCNINEQEVVKKYEDAEVVIYNEPKWLE